MAGCRPSGAGSPWKARQIRRTTMRPSISTPIEKCRLISVVTGVLRPMCGMVQPTMYCATSSARMSQCRAIAVRV